MWPSVRLLAIAITLSSLDPASADTLYRVRLGRGPAAYVRDAPSTLAAMGVPAAAPELVPAPSAGARDVPFERGDATAGHSPSVPWKPGEDVLPDRMLEPVEPPTTQFRDTLARIYGVSTEAEVQAIWRWHQSEPPTLATPERTGNAVVRYARATGQPVAGARTGPVDPQATRGLVASANGVSLRADPWGRAAATLPAGTPLTIVPPARDGWYQVETPSGRGWISALWIDVR